MLIAIAQLNFDGGFDKVIDHIKIERNNSYNIIEYMEEGGYTRIQESSTYFRKGRKVRYGYHVVDGKEIGYVDTRLYRYQELIAKI